MADGGKKSRAQIRSDQDIEIQRIFANTDRVRLVCNAIVKISFPICAAVIFFFLAGKNTSVKAVLDAAFKADISKYAAYVIASVFGVGWWRSERRRKTEVAELSKMNREFEILFDPKRSSSLLTPEGTPPKVVEGGVVTKHLPPGEKQ